MTRPNVHGMDDLQSLRARIDALETELSNVRRDIGRISEGKPSGSQPRITVAPPIPSAQKDPAKKRDARAWEFILAGNLLGKLGLFAVILATGWFIKLAFDEQWINESGRIYTGLVCGFLTVMGGLYLAHKSYQILPAAVVGTGSAILYISIWGAHHYYDLITFQEAFAMLVIMSAATAALSYAGQSQVLYAFSLAGSMLAPILLAKGENSYRFLFSYLTLVNAGFLLLSLRYSWRIVPWLLFTANVFLFSMWGADHIKQSNFYVPYVYVLCLFLMFSGRELFLVPRTASTFRIDEGILVVAAGVFGALASFWLFDTHYRSLRPHGSLAMAGLAALLFFRVDQMIETHPKRLPAKPHAEFLIRSAIVILLLPLLFTAITDFTEGRFRTAGWIVFAGALSIAGSIRKSKLLLWLSLLPWLAALLRLFFLEDRPPQFTPILNGRFAMHALATLFLGAVYQVQRKAPINGWMRAFVYAAMVTFIFGVLKDNHDYVSDPHYRNLGYSYVLAIHAVVMLAAGFSFSLVSWRRAGLALAALVVLKLYLYDIWTMGRAVRIIAGFSLGASLVALSILYHRFRGKIFPEEKQ